MAQWCQRQIRSLLKAGEIKRNTGYTGSTFFRYEYRSTSTFFSPQVPRVQARPWTSGRTPRAAVRSMCHGFPHRLQQVPFLPVEVLKTPHHPTSPRELGIVRPPFHPENQRPLPPCSRRPCRGSIRQQQPSGACSGCESDCRCDCLEKGDSGGGLPWPASRPWCWEWWRHWWDGSRWRRVTHGGRGAWDKCLRWAECMYHTHAQSA